MADHNQEATLQAPRRPNYSALNVPIQDDDLDTEQQEFLKNVQPTTSANGQTLLAQSNNGRPAQAPAKPSPKQNDLGKTVFTAPDGQEASFAAEIPGGIKGVTDKDSYLFITQDTIDGALTNKGWRAFVVPKDEPHKQYEISIKDVNFDTINRHELRATLGQGHDVVVGIGYTSLDNKNVTNIESTDELQSLVKQRIDFGGSWRENHSSTMYYSGDSWVIMKKDFESGQIERFTQSGTTGLGRLEIIQGEPVSADKRGVLSDAQVDWLYNAETRRHPQSTSNELMPLPDGMKRDVAEAARDLRASGWGDHRMVPALEKLTDVDAALAQVQQENKQRTAQLNAEERPKQQAPGKNDRLPQRRGIFPAAHP